jgi:dTDP-4-amino-4,6-dideoxygalactose transaminase
VFSFYATKVITGGQGGLVWSHRRELAEAVEDYRQFDCRETYRPRFNFQMTDIQAALVESQLGRLEAIRARRQAMSNVYLSGLPSGLSVQSGLADRGRMPYRFVVIAADGAMRDALREHMARAGVACAVPLERHELLHRYLGLDPAAFPVAERLVDTTLSLPIHLCLSDAEVGHIATALNSFKP